MRELRETERTFRAVSHLCVARKASEKEKIRKARDLEMQRHSYRNVDKPEVPKTHFTNYTPEFQFSIIGVTKCNHCDFVRMNF